jgi:hypothetical protein
MVSSSSDQRYSCQPRKGIGRIRGSRRCRRGIWSSASGIGERSARSVSFGWTAKEESHVGDRLAVLGRELEDLAAGRRGATSELQPATRTRALSSRSHLISAQVPSDVLHCSGSPASLTSYAHALSSAGATYFVSASPSSPTTSTGSDLRVDGSLSALCKRKRCPERQRWP